MAETKTTQEHGEIQRWAEERGGKPSHVKSTESESDIGILRIDFPGFSGEGSLEEITWEDFFEKFDAQGLALIYQEETADGEKSNFNKLVKAETAATVGHHESSSTPAAKSAPRKTAVKKAAVKKSAVKTPEKKVLAKKAPAKKTAAVKKTTPPAKKAVAKKTPAKKVAAKKAVKKVAAKKAVKKVPAKKAPAKKVQAKKAIVKKAMMAKKTASKKRR